MGNLLRKIEKSYDPGKFLLGESENSPTDQTNSQKSATEQGKNSYSLPEDTTPEERKAYVEEQVGPRLTSRNYGDIKKVNPFFKLLHSDGWRTWVPYRDVFKTPTVDDYYIGTKTTFTSIGTKPDGGNVTSLLEAEAENKKTWQQMKDSGKYEWHKSPLSDSEYLVDRETGDIYRFSDHWFRVASCDWAIDDFHANESLKGIYQIGKSNIKDFELNDRAKGNQVVQNPENRKPYEDALNETIANYEALLGSNVDMTRIVREEAEKALRQYKQLRDELQNSGKMATGNQVRYSLPLQPANDPAFTPEQNRQLSPDALVKKGEEGLLDLDFADYEKMPFRSQAGENGARFTSYGRLNERGRKEGLHVDFDSDGNLINYGLYHDGRREGMHYTFNPQGDRLIEGAFSNGTRVGTHRVFYDTYSQAPRYDLPGLKPEKREQVRDEITYNQQGRPDGEAYSYSSSGKLLERHIFKNGKLLAEWYAPAYLKSILKSVVSGDEIRIGNMTPHQAWWQLRAYRRNGSAPWIPQGQPGEGQPYKPSETDTADEADKPLHQWNPVQAVKENTQRRQARQLTIDFHEDDTAAPSNLSDPSDPSDLSDLSDLSDPSYNPAATRKGRQMPPSMLTDEELLLRTRTEEGSTDDWNLYNDEYDRRHRQEYADLTDHYRDVIEKTSPTLEDAYDMLATADQHFHYGGYASTERTELLAQRDVLQDYIDQKEAEQVDARGTDRYSLPEDQQRTDDIIKAAEKHFGTTRDIREAGYILPDGKLLDFSGRHDLEPGTSDRPVRGQRTSDHRDIQQIAYDKDDNPTGITTDMADFIRRGAIRIDANNGAVNLAVKPTEQQRRRIRELVARNEGDIYIDFGDGDNTDHYAEYEGAKPTRILADIDRYFDEGIKPEGVTRYSKPMEEVAVSPEAEAIREKDVKNIIATTSEDKLPQTRKEALTMLDGMKQPFPNDDQGYEIYVSHANAKHSMNFRNEDQIKVIGVIDKVIANAVKIGEMPVAEDEKETTKKVHIFYAPVNIDNKQYSARLVVKEYEKGNFVVDQMNLYNTQLREEKKADSAQRPSSDGIPAHPETANNFYKVKELIHNTQEFDRKILGFGENDRTAYSLPGGTNATPDPASTGVTRGIDLSSWDPLASARQHVTDSRQARAEADQAWTDHRQRREQAIASHTAVKNDPNLTPAQKNRLQNDMIRRVADVRALVSKVREGDRESVKAVTQTVLDLADAVGDGLTRGAVKKLMHAVENATTKRDVKTEVDKAVDVILTQVTREAQRQTEKLLHTKATKLDPNNIRVAGQMEEHGQRSLRQLNELLSPEGQSTDLDQLEAELTDKEQNGRELAFSLLSKNYLSKYYKISQKKLT